LEVAQFISVEGMELRKSSDYHKQRRQRAQWGRCIYVLRAARNEARVHDAQKNQKKGNVEI
jgi:hypothetical protein